MLRVPVCGIPGAGKPPSNTLLSEGVSCFRTFTFTKGSMFPEAFLKVLDDLVGFKWSYLYIFRN